MIKVGRNWGHFGNSIAIERSNIDCNVDVLDILSYIVSLYSARMARRSLEEIASKRPFPLTNASPPVIIEDTALCFKVSVTCPARMSSGFLRLSGRRDWRGCWMDSEVEEKLKPFVPWPTTSKFICKGKDLYVLTYTLYILYLHSSLSL